MKNNNFEENSQKSAQGGSGELSIRDFYTHSQYYMIHVGDGEWRPYLYVLKDAIEEGRKALAQLRTATNHDEKKQKKTAELAARVDELEGEYMRLTRFGKGELAQAMQKLFGGKWRFAHYQEYDQNSAQWKLKLALVQEGTRRRYTFFSLPLTSQIDNLMSYGEVKRKLTNAANTSIGNKGHYDSMLVYLKTGDPQFSYNEASAFTHSTYLVSALDEHLNSHNINMEIYNSFGAENFSVLTPKDETPAKERGRQW